MKSSIKHNKLRNTGILFELLARQITADILENKQNGLASKLMREFFNSKKELGKELMLYRAFFNTNNISEQKAFQLLSLILEQRKKLNERTLNEEKYLLIKEIKNNFNLKEFFSVRVPTYKTYASIYKTFDAAVHGLTEIENIEELANSQFTIVEHLSGKLPTKELKEQNEISNLVRGQSQDIRFLSYKILIERFNDKYKALSENQRKLLKEYIYSINNPSKLREYIHAESRRLRKEILENSTKVKDTVVRIKLKEVATQLRTIESSQVVKESYLTALLIAYEIVKELDTV